MLLALDSRQCFGEIVARCLDERVIALAARRIAPFVMSGGVGSRLWPRSRRARPKQFNTFVGTATLLRRTLGRFFAAPDLFATPVVMCDARHEGDVREQWPTNRPPPFLILEPVGRDTAACAAVAALWIASQGDPSALVLLAPADHLVQSVDAFADTASAAIAAAEEGFLVSFGVRPTRAETGYGYVRLGERRGPVHLATRFIEKPDRATAETYIAEGNYLWNAGYSLFRADRMIEELRRHAPDIESGAREALRLGETNDRGALTLDPTAFAAIRPWSIDYAVMEKSDRVAVAILDAGWSDIGSWASVWEAMDHDDAGNAIVGDVVALDTSDCLVLADGPLVAVSGVHDLIVVATPDAILVVPRERAQDVKSLVERLTALARGERL